MSALRRTAGTATDLGCRVLGRRRVVRTTRFVLHRARLDVPNDLNTDGESALQRWILDLSPPEEPICVFDVGANVGRWSAAMIAAARQAGRIDDLDLRAFEPSAYTFGCLTAALQGQPVRLHRLAIGEESGAALLRVIAPGAGTNSLHEAPDEPGNVQIEEVPAITLAEYADRATRGHVMLVKVDTEGHDLAVLRGARPLFVDQRISIVQFEYNHRWIYARYYLRDAFDLLGSLGYQIGKLTPFGVEFYPSWDADLETFVEGNYVACLASFADRLPRVRWWKLARR